MSLSELLELAQIHVHHEGDAIQPSCPLLSPFLPAFNLSQHQGLSNESFLCIRWPKYWSFNFGISPSSEYSGPISLGLTGLISLQPKGLSRVFSNTIVQKHNSLALNILYVIIGFLVDFSETADAL